MDQKIDMLIFYEGATTRPSHFAHPLEKEVQSQYPHVPSLSLDNFSDQSFHSYFKEALHSLKHVVIIYLVEKNCSLGLGLSLLTECKKASGQVTIQVIGNHPIADKLLKVLKNVSIYRYTNLSDYLSHSA